VTGTAEDIEARRRELVAIVEDEVRRFGDGAGSDTLDPRVRDALLHVPRERFGPEGLSAHAYVNRPLPIGHGQTISQPLVVALMTHHLALQPTDRVLDVGTGSGYQTAILASLAREVLTVEIVEPLACAARATLEAQGYRNITYLVGNGVDAVANRDPFDAILVAAAAESMPDPLLDALAPGGRMVIPVGRRPHAQDLVLVTRAPDGAITRRTLFPVAFVPLIGAAGAGP
jgi:protein-L-isoaspartate(D-aspartate) O-methyltransferase